MKYDKSEAYRDLVDSRKACRLCKELTNPSEYEDGIFDSKHIGPWTRWQGNLNSNLMIVGQDWGDTDYFEKHKGYDSDNNRTNKTIRELLSSIGVDIDLPSSAATTDGTIFFTNAILCLKKGGLGAPVKAKWFNNCGKQFLKPTIEIVKPQVVVSLGKRAYEVLRRIYNLPKMHFRDAVNQKEGFSLSRETLFFPMYHCSPRVLSTHRSFTQQKVDWQKVKNVL